MDIRILDYWRKIQGTLFPEAKEFHGPQTPQHFRVMVVLDFLNLDRFIYNATPKGRPPRDRRALAAAFVAKSVLNLPTTDALIDRLTVDRVLRRLCGFDATRKLPCKSTFSNAFAEFAEAQLPAKIHEALIESTYKDTLGGKIVGHVSRDSTAIPARCTVVTASPKSKKKKRKKIKGKNRRVVRQLEMDLPEMIEDLPRKADYGRKRNERWKGFKAHVDVADGGIPLSFIVTSASVHDNQVAIPLEEMTSRRVISCYTLMDSAYDAVEIRHFINSKNKVSIIEPHKRRGQTVILDPAERRRFRERTTVERAYSQLKDNFGVCQLRVLGHSKVTAHIGFAILALTAEQLIRVFS